MQEYELVRGDVVQIAPHDEKFGGCLMMVTEQVSGGTKGFVRIPGKGDAYYRVEWADMEFVGRAAWVPAGA